MDALTKAAVITWLLDRKVKVVHIWEEGAAWQAMVESPPCGRRGSAVTYPSDQKVGVGHGTSEIAALTSALEKIDMGGLQFRLHMLAFMVEHLANRAAPALLRRLEGGRT